MMPVSLYRPTVTLAERLLLEQLAEEHPEEMQLDITARPLGLYSVHLRTTTPELASFASYLLMRLLGRQLLLSHYYSLEVRCG